MSKVLADKFGHGDELSHDLAKLPVDLWSSGFRGGLVHLPLAQALGQTGRIDLRSVVSGKSEMRPAFEALDVPLLLTAGETRALRIPSTLMQVAKVRERLRKWYADRRPIVHVTMASAWDQFYLDVPKRHGAKILLTIHDAQHHVGEENPILLQLENRLIRMADDVAVLSSYAAERIATRLRDSRPVHVVAPGLVMSTNPPSPAKTFPSGRPMKFLFFGRIREYKGLDLALEAWKTLKSSDQRPMELTIAGSGDMARYAAALRGLPDVHVINTWLSDEFLSRLLEEHDVNLLPYLEGSTSATSLAGLWAGMPSIATPIGAFEEQLEHDRDALIMRNVSAPALAGAMRELLASKDLYNRLAQGAHRKAHALSGPVVARNWLNLYETIWSGRGLARAR